MRSQRRTRTALCAPLLWLVWSGAAGAADYATELKRAVELCGAGEIAAAANSLAGVLERLDTELGSGSEASRILRLRLAHIERARGNIAAAEAYEKLPPADPDAMGIDSASKQQLRKLRTCTPPPKPVSRLPAVEPTAAQQLEVAERLYANGAYRRALENAQLAREKAGPGGDPALRMRVHETLALIALQLGDAAGALTAASEAEELARAQGDLERRITLARLVAQAGDLERASQALKEVAEAGGSERARAELAEAHGDLALRLGAPREAIAHLSRALTGHQKTHGAEHASTAAVLHLRGDAFRLAGDFPAARRDYEAALKLRSATLGSDHPETARTRNAIGVLQAEIGDWRAADAAFAAALESLTKTLGAEHAETISLRANRALARWGSTESDAAANEYAKTVDDLSAALGEDHPRVAATVRNLSRIELDRGNAERAEALLEQALASQLRTLGEAHPTLAATRLQRGRLLAQRGEVEAAAREVERAIGIFRTALGPEHPHVARARTVRARLAAAQSDGATAFREASEASRGIAVHTRRTFGAISDRQRALLADDAHGVVGALLSAPGADPRALFVSLLPHRDSVLRSIAASRAAAQAGEGREYLQELNKARRRYVAAIHGQGPETAQRAEAIAREIEGLEVLAAASGSRMPLLDPQEVLDLACKRLPSDAALIKFVTYDRTAPGAPGRTVPSYAALLVRGSDCEITRVELSEGEKITAAAEQFATAMREQRSDAPGARAALGEALLAPLSAALGDVKRWLIVPDGALWGVPIGALPDPRATESYLLERVTVGYLTSTHELADRNARQPGKESLERSQLIGAPDFGSSEDGGPVVLTASGPCEIAPFESLPGTREELDKIAELVHEPQMLTGAEVTKEQLERALQSKPWLVHFATHAYFAGLGGCGEAEQGTESWRNGDGPIAANPLLLSGIVMAGANLPARVGAEVESGILTAYEVAGLDLHSAGLVVLSACDTGTGLHLRGQEVQGLRWGFRAAGARALVTSLWRSNDVATRKMMRSFYEALISDDLARDPLRGAEALRRAKLTQLESEKRLGIRRPLLWANFVFSGVL